MFHQISEENFLKSIIKLLVVYLVFTTESIMSFQMRNLPIFLKRRVGFHNMNTFIPKPSYLISSSNTLMCSKLLHDEHVMDESSLDFKNHPALATKKYSIPTILVPSAQVHTIISKTEFKSYLANTMTELDGVHPRVKVVRRLDDSGILDQSILEKNDYEDKSMRLVLLRPDALLENQNTEEVKFLKSFSVGPNITVSLDYTSFPIQGILSEILPPSALPPPTGFEQVGHILHLNLKDHHKPYGKLIGKLLLDRFSPRISCVIDKVGEVAGPYRTYPLEILACDSDQKYQTDTNKIKNSKDKYNPFWVEIQEAGINLQFDLQKVYWCSRLSGERAYLLKNELNLPISTLQENKDETLQDNASITKKRSRQSKRKHVEKGIEDSSNDHIIIADAFCGVGALCIQAYKQLSLNTGHDTKKNDSNDLSTSKVSVWANDWNADAVKFCRDNARRNGIKNIKKNKQIEFNNEGGFSVVCGDAFDFISELGMVSTNSDSDGRNLLPHHLLMNFPLDSPSFLGALRWWPSSQLNIETKVHLYTFARADDGYGEQNDYDNEFQSDNFRNAIEVAIDMVADSLVPEGGASEKSRFRGEYLNNLGCNVKAREVRDVAPGKVVVYVQFTVTKNLLKTMQGDFVDV